MNLKSDGRKNGLTKFICQELLYEYVTDRLTAERKLEIEDFLKTCKESQRELERLKAGLNFTEHMQGLVITDEFGAELLGFRPHWQKALSIWTAAYSSQGWKWMPYIFGIIVIGFGLAVFKPWNMRMRSDVMLVEHDRNEQHVHEEPSRPLPPKPSQDVAIDSREPKPEAKLEPMAVPEPPPLKAPAAEIAQVPSAPGPKVYTAQPTPLLGRSDNMVVLGSIFSTTSPGPIRAAANVPASNKPDLPTKPATQDRAEDYATAVGEKGWLTRAELDVNQFAASRPAIRDKIEELDGKVAGSVELGWLRQENEAYFHFSLPESNFRELEAFLKTFGPVRISKERHSRVMPEGQIRIILTVKDGNTYDEGPSETP